MWTGNGPTPPLLARFTIPGQPKPKQRPRVMKGYTYTPKETVTAETAVLDAFYDAHPFWTPLGGFLVLDVTFYRGDKRGVDLDNLFKLVADALNKHAYLDDSQIVSERIEKFYTTKARARTEVILSRAVGDRIEP